MKVVRLADADTGVTHNKDKAEAELSDIRAKAQAKAKLFCGRVARQSVL